MSSLLTSKVMKAVCTDDWVAKTYSEYLLSCAETKLEFIDAVQDASTDPTLSDIVDIWSDYLSDSQENLKFGLAPWLERSTYPNYKVEWTDPAFKEAYLAFVNTEDGILWWNNFSAGITIPDLTGYSGANDQEKFLSYMQTHNDDDVISEQPNFINRINILSNSYISSNKFDSDTTYTLNSACVNLKELFKQVVMHSQVNKADDVIKLQGTNFSDEALAITEMSLDEFWNETKSNLGSTIAWAEGFAHCMIENISDTLASFKEKISTYFSDASSYINQSINTVKSTLISTKGNVSEFVHTAGELLGWSQIGDTLQTVDETDMSQYTGASPYSDISLQTAKGIAVATGKTVAAAAIIAWNGIKKVGEKIWKKVKPLVQAVTTNPNDIGTVDKDADSYTFQNFSFNVKDDGDWNITNKYYHIYTFNSAADESRAYNALVSQENKWIAYQTVGGEYLFRITRLYTDGSDDTKLWVFCEYQYKPRVVDVIKALNAGQLVIHNDNNTGKWITPNYALAPSSGTYDVLLSNIEKFKADGYRCEEDDYEEKKYVSLAATNVLNYSWNQFAVQELIQEAANHDPFPIAIRTHYPDNHEDFTAMSTYAAQGYASNAYYRPSFYMTDAEYSSSIDKTHNLYSWKSGSSVLVTNTKVLQDSCGYSAATHNFNQPNWNWEQADDFNNQPSIEHIITPLITVFLYQRIDKILNPDSYVYIPYSSDNYTFMDPHYRIITDAEHQNVAQIFITAIVVVAVIAITVLVGLKIAKVFKAKKIARLNNKKGIIDNAMWNGTTLPDGSKPTSAKNAKKYLRYSKKLDKLSGSVTGLSSAPSAYENISKIVSSTSNIFNENQDSLTTNSLDASNIYLAITGNSL